MFFFDTLTGTYNSGLVDIVFPRDFGVTKDMGTDHSFRYVQIPTNPYLGIRRFYVGYAYGSGSSGNYIRLKRDDGTAFSYEGTSATERDIDGFMTVYMKYEGTWHITNTNSFNIYIMNWQTDGITVVPSGGIYEWKYNNRRDGLIIWQQ